MVLCINTWCWFLLLLIMKAYHSLHFITKCLKRKKKLFYFKVPSKKLKSKKSVTSWANVVDVLLCPTLLTPKRLLIYFLEVHNAWPDFTLNLDFHFLCWTVKCTVTATLFICFLSFRHLRLRHPADSFLRVNSFTLHGTMRKKSVLIPARKPFLVTMTM